MEFREVIKDFRSKLLQFTYKLPSNIINSIFDFVILYISTLLSLKYFLMFKGTLMVYINISDSSCIYLFLVVQIIIYYAYFTLNLHYVNYLVKLINSTINDLISFINYIILSLFVILFTISILFLCQHPELIYNNYLKIMNGSSFFVLMFLFFNTIRLFSTKTKSKISLVEIFNFNSATKFQFPLDDIPLDDEELCTHNKQIVSNVIDMITYTRNSKKYISIALNGRWGIGKTSILNKLKNKLTANDDFRIIDINFWQAKDPKDVVLEIDRQFDEFFNEYLVDYSRSINFFKNAAGFYNGKISNIMDLFSIDDKKSMKNSLIVLNNKIKTTLKLAKKKKIIIVFDDIDRVLLKENINFFLKIITYVIKFDNVVSITGVDLEKLIKIIYPSYSEYSYIYNRSEDQDSTGLYDTQNQAHIKDENDKLEDISIKEVNEWDDFIYKVFNNVYDLPSQIVPPDIKKYTYNLILNKKYRYGNQYLCYLNFFLSKFNFCEIDKVIIIQHLSTIINSKVFYEIFKNFRELKLAINEFFMKLLAMRSGTNFIITNRISPVPLFVLSTLKIINPCYFYSFIKHCKVHENKHYNIERYFYLTLNGTENQGSNTPINGNRIKDLLNLINLLIPKGIKTNIDILLESRLGNFKYKFTENNINNPDVIKYYNTPISLDYQFVYEELESHFEELIERIDTKVIEDYLGYDKKDYFQFEQITYELKEIINNYIFNFKQYVNRKNPINSNYKDNFILKVKFFNAFIETVLKLNNTGSDNDYYQLLFCLMSIFDITESFPEKFEKKYVNQINFDNNELKSLYINSARLLKEHTYIFNSPESPVENKTINLLQINLIPLEFGIKFGFLINDSKYKFDQIFDIDKEFFDRCQVIKDERYDHEIKLLNLTLIKSRLNIMNSFLFYTLNGKSYINESNKLKFHQYFEFLLNKFYENIGTINLDNFTSQIEYNLLITNIQRVLQIDLERSKWNVALSKTNQDYLLKILNESTNKGFDNLSLVWFILKSTPKLIEPIPSFNLIIKNKPSDLSDLIKYINENKDSFKDKIGKKNKAEFEIILNKGLENFIKYNETLKTEKSKSIEDLDSKIEPDNTTESDNTKTQKNLVYCKKCKKMRLYFRLRSGD